MTGVRGGYAQEGVVGFVLGRGGSGDGRGGWDIAGCLGEGLQGFHEHAQGCSAGDGGDVPSLALELEGFVGLLVVCHVDGGVWRNGIRVRRRRRGVGCFCVMLRDSIFHASQFAVDVSI